MARFVSSFSGVLIILIMVLVGYVLTKKGWFDEKAPNLIAKLVTQVALPCYMISTIVGRFTAKELLEMLSQLRFPALSMVILLAIAVAVAHLFLIDKKHQGLFVSMFFNSNTIFVGLPINQALFGDKSIPYVLVYYMCNTTFFWTIGTYLIQRDGRKEVTLDLRGTLKKIFSPPLMGFIIGVILVLLNIKLPAFLLSDFQYLGNLTIPLSMIFIGISVANVGLSRLRFTKGNVLVLVGRFVIAPLLMLIIVKHTQMPQLMKQVFILQSAMPVMTNAPVVAKLYGADADYAAIMVTESTLLTLLVVPILMSLVSLLG